MKNSPLRWLRDALFVFLTTSALLVPALPVVAQLQQPPLPTAGKTIQVTFWNVRWFPGGKPDAPLADQKKQIQAVQREVAKLSPDILGMEEVRDYDAAGIAVKPLRGFKVDVCSAFPPREGQTATQQVAIASRLQPLSAWYEPWQPGHLFPPRGFAFAAYQVAPDQVLLVYALHLKSNLGAQAQDIAMREDSIRQVLSHEAAMEEIYGKFGAISCIMGGDFNTSPEDPQFRDDKSTRALMDRGFAWSWQGVPLAKRITIPPEGAYPGATFDHIFYSGATLQRALVTVIPPEASDHRPVSATLRLTGVKKPVTAGVASTPAATRSATAAEATDAGSAFSPFAVDELRKKLGQIVAIQGRIVSKGANKPGTIHYLDFSSRRQPAVSLVFFNDKIAVESSQLDAFVGKDVRVTGEVSEYKGGLQIVISDLSHIKVISGAQ